MNRTVLIAIGAMLCGLAGGQRATAADYDAKYLPMLQFMEKNCGSRLFNPAAPGMWADKATIWNHKLRLAKGNAKDDEMRQVVTVICPTRTYTEGGKEVGYFLVFFDKGLLTARRDLKITASVHAWDKTQGTVSVVNKLGSSTKMPGFTEPVQYEGFTRVFIKLQDFPTSPVIIRVELLEPTRQPCDLRVQFYGHVKAEYQYDLYSPKYISIDKRVKPETQKAMDGK